MFVIYFFNDETYNHILKDQITQIIISEFRFNNAFMDEDEESEDDQVPCDIEGVYDYDQNYYAYDTHYAQ